MVLVLDAGMVGTSEYNAYLVPNDVSAEELSNYAWEAAMEHASSYGNEQDEEGEWSVSEPSGWFEEYDSSKHDGRLIYGDNDGFTWHDF